MKTEVTIACIFIIGILCWKIDSMSGQVTNLKEDKAALEQSLKLQSSFISKYETARRKNEAQDEKHRKMVIKIQNDPNCMAPDSFRQFIDGLQ